MGRTCFARSILPILLERTKKPPLKGEVPAKRAEGFHPQRCNGRGGSVSRRDLNPKTGKRAHLAWAHKPGEKVKPIPSRSSGGGPWEGKTAIAAGGG